MTKKRRPRSLKGREGDRDQIARPGWPGITSHLGKDGPALLSAYSCDCPVAEKFLLIFAPGLDVVIHMESGR